MVELGDLTSILQHPRSNVLKMIRILSRYPGVGKLWEGNRNVLHTPGW